MNYYQWNSGGKLVAMLAGMIEVSEITALATQVEALSRKIDSLSTQKSATVMACDTCGEGHASLDCPIVRAMHGPIEQVDFICSALR